MKKDEKDEQGPRVRPNIRPDTQEYKLWLFLISCSGSGMKQARVWNKLWYETSWRAAKLRQFETISHLINPKLTPKGKV